MAERRTVRIERRTYSSKPWRLIDSETGFEIQVDTAMIDTQLGEQRFAVAGYATKREAVDALGRAAGTGLDLLDRVRELEAADG